jgi:hypothetical protein
MTQSKILWKGSRKTEEIDLYPAWTLTRAKDSAVKAESRHEHLWKLRWKDSQTDHELSEPGMQRDWENPKNNLYAWK